MPLYDASVPVRYTAPLIDYIQSQRPQWRDAALDAAGIDEVMLHDANAVLTLSQFEALWSAIRRLTGRSDLGFELGSRITENMHGALGTALKRCTNNHEVLQLFARYHRLVSSSFSFQYRHQGEQTEIIYRPVIGMSAATLRDFYEIHAVSLHVQLKARLQERLPAYDVYMPMEAPAHSARYRELRPARFHFSPMPLPEVRIVLDSSILDLPLAASTATSSAPSDDLSSLQGQPHKSSQWSAWVEMMLRETDGHQPTLEELAELLNVCAHTLARYLAREGQSFRTLSTQVRHQRACAMLGSGQHSITQIAYRLGYRDAANFSHAFRTFCGQSPSAFRGTQEANSTGA